jgi:radical SAM superfamily enzyme YgiQ (UPF0313 family)
MSHVTFLPLVGFRIREQQLLELGMSLPGLRPRAKAIGELPALGSLTLAGMLPPHWTCSYHSIASWDEDLVERVVAEQPTLVAISALTASINEAYALSAALRQRGIRVVLGGLHVTACPEEAREYADSIVVGEGEPVWSQLLADAERGNLRPIYQADRLSRLRHHPLPRFDLLDQPQRYTVQTQRGCPLACDFCGASRLLGAFHEKPIARIREELHAVVAHSPCPLIELADDNTFAGTRDPHELYEALAEVGARYFTEADWRIGERDDVLRGLAASGCVQILMGIESLVFRYPGMGAKQAELDRVMAAVERIQDAGVAVNGCFIIGADGETRASLDRLAEFLATSPFAEVQLTLQTPFPGTSLYRRLQRQGRLLTDRDWSHYSLFDVTYRPDAMSVEDLERGFRELVARVFSRKETNRRSQTRRKIMRTHRPRADDEQDGVLESSRSEKELLPLPGTSGRELG